MNSEDIQEALVKLGNPNILVNLVSRRVRQLSTPGGKSSRPLLSDTATMGHAEIALKEYLNDKMDWDFSEEDNPLAPEFNR